MMLRTVWLWAEMAKIEWLIVVCRKNMYFYGFPREMYDSVTIHKLSSFNHLVLQMNQISNTYVL